MSIWVGLLLTGCVHIADSTPEKDLASAVFSGEPGGPQHVFRLTSGKRLVTERFFQGKQKEKSSILSDKEFLEMQALFMALFNELKSAKQVEGIAGGTNIRIILDGNEDGAAVLNNYASRFYKIDSLNEFKKRIESLVPKTMLR